MPSFGLLPFVHAFLSFRFLTTLLILLLYLLLPMREVSCVAQCRIHVLYSPY